MSQKPLTFHNTKVTPSLILFLPMLLQRDKTTEQLALRSEFESSEDVLESFLC